MEGLRLTLSELGRGSFGIVIEGSYRGASCAVKILTSPELDRTALREVLLGPSLVHPNVVLTYASRCARLTHDFFDMLEGNDKKQAHDPVQPRWLQPTPLISGDGFGDPAGLRDGLDPLLMLHKVLFELKATVGQVVVVLVQEYCIKGTLASAIHRGIFVPSPLWSTRVARRALLRTAAELARGLLHLHDAGVIHGDLKPANVLLQGSRGDRRGFTAKVADFGLAYVLPGAANSMSADGWGSLAYMAPEMFSGKVSRAVDVWAFGVMLWELLTGKLPYKGLKRQELISGIQSGSVALVWPEPESVPMASAIIDLGRRCLSRAPADRPSFLRIVDELVEIEKGIRAALLARAPEAPESLESQDVSPPPAAAATAASPAACVAAAAAAACGDGGGEGRGCAAPAAAARGQEPASLPLPVRDHHPNPHEDQKQHHPQHPHAGGQGGEAQRPRRRVVDVRSCDGVGGGEGGGGGGGGGACGGNADSCPPPPTSPPPAQAVARWSASAGGGAPAAAAAGADGEAAARGGEQVAVQDTQGVLDSDPVRAGAGMGLGGVEVAAVEGAGGGVDRMEGR